jgi:hypothetical protein
LRIAHLTADSISFYGRFDFVDVHEESLSTWTGRVPRLFGYDVEHAHQRLDCIIRRGEVQFEQRNQVQTRKQ